MSFSPESSGDEDGAQSAVPSPVPSLGSSTAYLNCTTKFLTPANGPSWGVKFGKTVVCMRNLKLYVATSFPQIVEATGNFGPVVAFAGPKGPCKNGRWHHTRNRFPIKHFVPPEAISLKAIRCPTFKTTKEAYLTFFGALHCDFVAVFPLCVTNSAFVGIGINRGEGCCTVLETKLCRFTFDEAKAELAKLAPIDADCTVLDSKGRTLLPQHKRAVLGDNRIRRFPRAPGACWHAIWDGRLWTKQRQGAVVQNVKVDYGKNGLVLITLCLSNPLSGRVKCFLEEKPAYNKYDMLLGALGKTHEVTCRLFDPQTIQIPIKLASIIRLQKSRDHPRITATIGCFDDKNGSKPHCAIGNVQIRRHWHTDARTGNGYRVQPQSSRFAYLPAHALPSGVSEIARICSSDTHIGASHPRQLLSLVRAEDLPREKQSKVVAELFPGEAQVALQTLQEIKDSPRKRHCRHNGAVLRYRQCTTSSAPQKGCFVTAPQDLQF